MQVETLTYGQTNLIAFKIWDFNEFPGESVKHMKTLFWKIFDCTGFEEQISNVT